MFSVTFIWILMSWTQKGVGRANSLPVEDGLSVEQLTAAIRAIHSRVSLGAAPLASYAPEYDSTRHVCRAAFAALDAILAH
jgi:arginase family enzyme